MNPAGSSAGGSPNTPRKKEIQLQGARPPQLRVSQESRKIKKPPPHPQPIPPIGRPPLPPAASQWPQPLIIYDISPKVLHVAENNFMSVVQRLTGLSSAASATDGDLSPAVRLATIEKASPRSERGREREREREIEVSDMMDLTEVSVEFGQIPGILSPAPGTLAPIPTGFFSPAIEPQWYTYSLIHELSPHWPSPSALFQAPLVSPISSPNIFTNLFDF